MNIKLTFDKYTWRGFLYCWFISWENGLAEGAVRHVYGNFFKVTKVHKRWPRNEIYWTRADLNSYEAIHDFKQKIVGAI